MQNNTLGGSWFSMSLNTCNHKALGWGYLIAALSFGLLSWGASVYMRWELYSVTGRLFTKNTRDMYAGVVTIHALTMIFFMVMPGLWGGFGNYLMPLSTGTSEVAYPRWNNLALYILVVSFFSVMSSCFFEWGQGTGWTMYAPLSTSKAGVSAFAVDFVMAGLLVNGISSTMTSLNFVGTWLCNSIEGATTSVYSMSIVVVSILLLTVLPVLTGALSLVMGERHGGLTAFDNYYSGDALLYEHLFWVFGHPEVYILIIPAFALVSNAHVLFYSSLFGSTGMIQGVVGIGVVGWVVWAHHMYTTGMTSDTVAYFAAATMLVAVPTASKVFHWLGTIHCRTM